MRHTMHVTLRGTRLVNIVHPFWPLVGEFEVEPRWRFERDVCSHPAAATMWYYPSPHAPKLMNVTPCRELLFTITLVTDVQRKFRANRKAIVCKC